MITLTISKPKAGGVIAGIKGTTYNASAPTVTAAVKILCLSIYEEADIMQKSRFARAGIEPLTFNDAVEYFLHYYKVGGSKANSKCENIQFQFRLFQNQGFKLDEGGRLRKPCLPHEESTSKNQVLREALRTLQRGPYSGYGILT